MSVLKLNGSTAVRIIRVFLGSPGDLGPERRAARDAVDEINRTVARPSGYHVDLVGWEDTLSSVGRPQAVINEELDTCHVFIGLLWQRWGTPPALDGIYTSGFEEEYLRSKARQTSTGAPFIRLFFKDVDASKTEDAGPELRRVLDFKGRIIDEKSILFQTFDTVATFTQHVRVGLADYINRLDETDQPKRGPAIGSSGKVESATDAQPIEPPAGMEAEIRLLADIAASLQQPEGEALDSATVARLRNLALALGNQNNDQNSLGAHDANLIYCADIKDSLSDREISALADAGLDAFSDENAPLWSWLANRMCKMPDWLILSTSFGPDKRRINAFRVLKMLRWEMPLHSDNYAKQELLKWWFGGSSNGVKVAALAYLATMGKADDLEVIRAEIREANYATRSAAHSALMSVLLREDTSSAVDVLIGLSDVTLDDDVMAAAVEVVAQLSTDKLSLALNGAKISSVRLQAFRCLDERDALSDSAVLPLLDDNSLEVRAAALLALERRGRSFSESEAEAVLVRKKSVPVLGLGSPGEEGREALNDFRARQQSAQTAKALEVGSRTEPFKSDGFYFALCRKEPKKQIGKLRSHFDDRFNHFFAEYVSIIRRAYSSQGASELLEKLTAENENFWRRRWMRSALSIMEIEGDKVDLDRIRKALDEDAVDPSQADIVFLEKYGSWEDIARVCKISADYRTGDPNETILSPARSRRRAAQAVLSLAKGNLISLLASGLLEGMIPSVIAESKQSSFRAVQGRQLDDLLFNSSDEIRKATSLKTLLSDGVGAVGSKRNRYASADRNFFYNVIFWLDLSGAFPVSVVRKIAREELRAIK